ncbi:PREDICTED: nucleoprotein TPR isoform X2 [Nicrophorus vespilloides]|uniref:Nucleoprotein TPR n=1 Tax=Nicrophorus vespilloides TaxID=110193 RepID=A0ABM1ME57_NICVS|nr:PREDICTED: nucleoprotein TPR isoform X2 [Nicrophorus vespilloides]
MEEKCTGRDIVSAAITDKEWKRVPSEIIKKLEINIGEKLDEFITARALLETRSYNAVQTLLDVEKKCEGSIKQQDELSKKLDKANGAISELEKQLTISLGDVTKLQVNANKMEQDFAEMRNSRNLITDERDELSRMVERRNGELERMQSDINSLTKQLEDAVAAKCEVLAKVNEVDSMKLSIEYREKRMEQERSLLTNQIDTLNTDLEKKIEENLNMRRDNTSRCVQLEIKLSERTQEMAAANESIKSLTETNNNLMAKTEELMQKMITEKDTHSNTLEAFQQEVDAQKKIAELYKGVNEEQTKHAEELSNAVQEMKEKLEEALDKYGDLETKFKESELCNEEILNKKNECIAMLKKELQTANEVLTNKQDNGNVDNDDISPNTTPASRFTKSPATKTEIYSQYVHVSELLAQEKSENARLHNYMHNIVKELEDKGPLIAKQREHYEIALEKIEELTKQIENTMSENQQLRVMNSEYKRSEASASRENARMKKEITDLGRQVCNLLREIEHSRSGTCSIQPPLDKNDSTTSCDIISKRLVTFNDIYDLQTNNQRLLALVRELSTKQEEAEMLDPSMVANLTMKLDSMRESHAELLEEQEKQNNMVKMLMDQRDTYKNLYHQFVKGTKENIPAVKEKDDSSVNENEMQTDANDKTQELEENLQKLKKELLESKDEFDVYKKEKDTNEKMLVDQSEKMRTEIQELMKQNTKLSAKVETNNEMLKVSKINADVYKNQIERLEERNRIYSESIVKHETAQSYLNEQLMEAQRAASKLEVNLAGLRKEHALIEESEKRLLRERESMHREHNSHVIMQTNIELIKATLERNDAESKIRVEETLKEAHRECAALRRRLQEEQDHFRESQEHLEKQTKTAQTRMQEEKDLADKLRKDLMESRDDLSAKSVQLEELSKKLKNSIMGDMDTSVETKKYREMEQQCSDRQAEIEALKNKLKISKEAVDQHSNVALAAEKQLIDITEKYQNDKTNYESKITDLQSKLTELEEKCAELQGELSLQTDGQVSVTSNLHGKLHKLEIQQKVATTELIETKEQLDIAKSEISKLSENLEIAENKYAREMSLHSADLQALRSVKEDLNKLLNEVNEVKFERDRSIEALEESKSSWGVQEEKFIKEKTELQMRLSDLDKQNTLLLDQLQELNSQMSLMQTQLIDPHNKSMNESNRSFTEDDVRSSDQLLKIIKYLRQEKDIAVSKCEILDAEHTRIKAQHDLLRKEYDQAKATIENERQKSEVSIVTAAKHAEVLRKVETLNAITDSNRSLRLERDGLIVELNELKARTGNLEEQLAPLQEKNTELQKKAEAMQTENITLRGEATRWRQRANNLLERSNRTSPEDWKKLQGERESLAKQLTIERSNTTRLTEENNVLTKDKAKLEDSLRQLKAQQEQQKDEMDKLSEELGSLRTQVNNLNQDLEQSRNQMIRVNEDNRVLTENLAAKETMVVDVKNNLAQIRKIAKKYKIQAEEQLKELEILKKVAEDKQGESSSSEDAKEVKRQSDEKITQLEQTHNEKLNEMNVRISSSVEENEQNKKEIETLKENLQNSLEKEERFKVLFKNAKERIMLLTEQNSSLRNQIDKENSSGSNDPPKQQGDSADLERCHKEKEELASQKQQDKERYLQEIESLNQKVGQLQRQIGVQQGSKPSTSSEKEKSTSEPPTANIKPMAGHSTNTQTQSVPIQPWRSSGEPPLASIRPMSMQLRTVAVLPTSQSPSTVMVPPQQQVHTTGSSSIEAMSSSPTSSHTDYVPATSSASSALLGPRQVAVPPTQSNQDTEDEDTTMQVQQAPQQQAVALVLPRVEPPSPAQEQGTSSSSSNTVTTTQAGHKRPREADTENQHEDGAKTTQAVKRTRLLPGTSSGVESGVSESGLEVEYQVPTSSQRDHEEDAVIVVESDEEGPDEGEGEDYNMPYEDPDTQDPDQDDEEHVGNEVEVIEDSSEVPNQSERGAESDLMPVDGEEEEECEGVEETEEEVMQPEATSSGTNVSTSVAVTLPSFSRTRQVAPLSRQQQTHLLLPHGIEEGGDDDSGTPSNLGSNDVLPEQTLEMAQDDNSTGRSVPSTPLQTSPHESGPTSEEQAVAHQNENDIPTITVSGAEDEAESAEGGDCMGPPSVAGTSTEGNQSNDPVEEMQEGDDGVSSEGEKAASTEDGEEEGREAEASPSTNTRSRNIRGGTTVATRRTMRQSNVRGVSRSLPTPIIWGGDQPQQQQLMQQPQQQLQQPQQIPPRTATRQDAGGHRGGGRGGLMSNQGTYSPRGARRNRGRGPRTSYNSRF